MSSTFRVERTKRDTPSACSKLLDLRRQGRRLRHLEAFGRSAEVGLLGDGDGDEVAKMPQFHGRPVDNRASTRSWGGTRSRILIGARADASRRASAYEVMFNLTRALRVDLPEIELDLRLEMLTPVQVAALLDHSLDIGFLRRPSATARSTSRSCVASH